MVPRILQAAVRFALPLVLLGAFAGPGVLADDGPDAGERTAALERALAADPGDVGTRLRLAELYASLGRTDDAIDEYRAVLDLVSLDSEAGLEASRRLRFILATRHAERQEFDEAIAIFGELVEEYPDNVLIRYSIAVAYLLRGDADEAQAEFERVIELDARYIPAYVNLASVHEQRGELERAIELLQAAIDVDPDSAPANRARVRLDVIEGNLLSREGNVSDAIAAYDSALDSEPGNREALIGLAELHRRTGDTDAELEVYGRIAAAHPGDVQSRLRLTEILIARREYREAYDELDAVAEQRPQGMNATLAQELRDRLHATEAGRRLAEERVAAEIARLEAHLEADPQDLQAWKELAVLQFQRRDRPASVRAFEAAAAIDPDDLQARYALAALYDSAGRFADSVRQYAAVLRLEPDERVRERVRATLQVVNAKRLYVEARYREAIVEFEQILAEDPDNELAHFYLGLIYAEEEEILRAVDAYREVIRIVPSHVGARLNLASSYERLNREEDAIDEYEKILQANPPKPIAEHARRAMDNARRRMRGFSANLGYVTAYDDNTNLSASDEIADFRSDLTLNLAWQYRASNDLRWRFLFSPSYSTYHRGQFDYLNTTTTLSAGLLRGRYHMVGGFTHRTSEGLVTSSRIGRMGTVFAEGLTRRKLPPILRPWSDERTVSSVAATLSYTDFEGESNPFFSAYTSAAGVSVSQPLREDRTLRAGYQFVINSNKELVGSDYAYTSHGLSLGLDYRRPWGSMNANYGLTLLDYTNPDSFSQFTRTRRNLRHSLALGTTWRVRPDISLFTTVSWTRNSSNLPVGFVLSSEDIIEGLQSSSLSDYQRLMVTAGLTLNF